MLAVSWNLRETRYYTQHICALKDKRFDFHVIHQRRQGLPITIRN